MQKRIPVTAKTKAKVFKSVIRPAMMLGLQRMPIAKKEVEFEMVERKIYDSHLESLEDIVYVTSTYKESLCAKTW